MIRGIIILVFFILNGFNLNAQEDTSKKEALPTIDEKFYAKAEKAYRQDNIDSTFVYIDSALFYIQKNQNWDLHIKYILAKSSIYFYQGDYFNFDSTLQVATQLANKNLDYESPTFGFIYNSWGRSFLDIGDFDKAIKNFKKTLNIEKKSKDKFAIASVLNNLGDVYYEKGDYNEALNHYQECKQYRFDSLANDWRVAKSSIHIANTYRKKNNEQAALNYYKEAINILEEIRSGPEMKDTTKVFKQLTIAYLNLGEIALENKNWKEAKTKVAEAEKYNKGVYVFDEGRGVDILGEINMQQGNYKKALEYCFKSLELAKEEFKVFEKHPVKAEKTLKIANVYTRIGDWENALQYYLRALDLVTHDFNSSDVEQNPLPENIYSNLIALDALEGKAECFFQFYQENKTLPDLKTAYQTYQSSLDLIPSLRKSFRQEGSKELLSPKVLPLFEKAIELTLILFNETTDSIYLHDAFQFEEGNKAILLLESINENNAIKKSGISEDLIKKELELNLEISYVEKLKNEEEQKIESNEDYIKSFNRLLFNLNHEYQTLIERLENDYPKYREIKNKTELVRVKELQRKLPNSSTALIEYFVGDHQVYIFTITSNGFTVSQFKKENSFEKSIVEIQKIISQPPSSQDEINSYKKYISNGQYLFQKLIKPSLLKEVKSLVIIPDDILGLLPFEILLTEPPVGNLPSYHLEDLSYLFEQVEISYNYSSTLFANKVEENKSSSQLNFVGFAPSFQNLEGSNSSRTCEINELYNLKNSKEEITRIQAIWGGKIFVDEAANISSFKTFAPQSDIIHLATHACIDQNNHQFNKIFFTDDYLSNNDLYNFFSQSRLAVLSACNTGSGQLVKGEGVMSLSRGFIHAGCPSVVMSLWSVDDRSTSKIMEKFYQNLKDGKTKDNSLRQAKLEYLSSAKKSFKHPYYWAAFVQFGDARSLATNSFFSYKKILLIGLIFFTSLLFFQYVKRK